MKKFKEVEKILHTFYLTQKTFKTKTSPFSSVNYVTNNSKGLGDQIILTSLKDTHHIKSILLQSIDNKYLLFNQISNPEGDCICISNLAQNDWGGGHCIQRLQKSLGLKPMVLPKAKLKKENIKTVKNKVFVHLENNTDRKRNIPNSFSEEHKFLIYKFFDENKEFIPYYFNNNLDLNQIIEIIASCEYFLGIDSGPMHVAAALDIKSIIVINDPTNNIYLPKIKECEIPNAEWLYPQNVHLNRINSNELVPCFNIENLDKAFKGEIYPYWSTEFLNIKSL